MYKLNNIKFKNIEDLKRVKYILRDTENSCKRYIKKHKLTRYQNEGVSDDYLKKTYTSI